MDVTCNPDVKEKDLDKKLSTVQYIILRDSYESFKTYCEDTKRRLLILMIAWSIATLVFMIEFGTGFLITAGLLIPMYMMYKRYERKIEDIKKDIENLNEDTKLEDLRNEFN